MNIIRIFFILIKHKNTQKKFQSSVAYNSYITVTLKNRVHWSASLQNNLPTPSHLVEVKSCGGRRERNANTIFREKTPTWEYPMSKIDEIFLKKMFHVI